MCVFGTRTAMIDTLLKMIEQQAKDREKRRVNEREGEREKRNDERTEGGEEEEEGDHVKKSSSLVCQSFYNDTVVVIRIYIHYKASECMTWMYLHFNSECTCNLLCTIDLMM